MENKQQGFILSFAEAYFTRKEGLPQFGGSWNSTDGIDTEIIQSDNTFEAYWTSNSKKKKITGKICNRGAKIILYEEKYVPTASKSEYTREQDGYTYITDDGQQLHIMLVDDSQHQFIDFTKQP